MAEVVTLAEFGDRVEARRLELIGELRQRGATEQADGTGTVSWLAARTRITRRSVARTVKLAGDLRTKLPRVAARYRHRLPAGP